MAVRDKIAAVLAFKTLPTTVLSVLLYAILLSSVFVSDELPKIPRNQGGLDLRQAYDDLHHVSYTQKGVYNLMKWRRLLPNRIHITRMQTTSFMLIF